MSSTCLTAAQVSQVVAVFNANLSNPAATWAALASMGDQYAAAAFQGLTSSASTFGQVISNSTTISGVSGSQYQQIAINNVSGYVQLLRSAQPNVDGTTSLPNTTAIETNYYNAVVNAGANPLGAIDLSIAKMAQDGLTDGENWYTSLFGTGLDLDPSRIGPPSLVLDNIDLTAATAHFFGTAGLTLFTEIGSFVAPTQLNVGEEAQLAAINAIAIQTNTRQISVQDGSGNQVGTISFLGTSNNSVAVINSGSGTATAIATSGGSVSQLTVSSQSASGTTYQSSLTGNTYVLNKDGSSAAVVPDSNGSAWVSTSAANGTVTANYSVAEQTGPAVSNANGSLTIPSALVVKI